MSPLPVHALAMSWLALTSCFACQQRVLLGFDDNAGSTSGSGGAFPASTSTDGLAPLGLPEPGEVSWSADVETGDLRSSSS